MLRNPPTPLRTDIVVFSFSFGFFFFRKMKKRRLSMLCTSTLHTTDRTSIWKLALKQAAASVPVPAPAPPQTHIITTNVVQFHIHITALKCYSVSSLSSTGINSAHTPSRLANDEQKHIAFRDCALCNPWKFLTLLLEGK